MRLRASTLASLRRRRRARRCQHDPSRNRNSLGTKTQSDHLAQILNRVHCAPCQAHLDRKTKDQIAANRMPNAAPSFCARAYRPAIISCPGAWRAEQMKLFRRSKLLGRFVGDRRQGLVGLLIGESPRATDRKAITPPPRCACSCAHARGAPAPVSKTPRYNSPACARYRRAFQRRRSRRRRRHLPGRGR